MLNSKNRRKITIAIEVRESNLFRAMTSDYDVLFHLSKRRDSFHLFKDEKKRGAIPLLRSAEHSAELVWPRFLFYLIAQGRIRFLFYWPDRNQRELRFFIYFSFNEV